ncbi:hypothetical protein [Streptacidiphilus cavernicola]|uniref:Uncharacterized protein n=1 Tax=Streptacidiphilus cavernicola TaxID=3342716 RepID=A0ABV6W4Q1_9ACTN
MPESVTLSTVNASGEQAQVKFEISDQPPANIKMSDNDLGIVEFGGVDLFDCLINVRKFLELNGRLLCCQGACPSVLPSGMTRQMTDGRMAYRLRDDGVALSDEDLVDIFAPAECFEVVGVVEHRRAVIDFYGFKRKNS